MSKPRRSQPEIADIVALAHALEGDERRSTTERATRENRFAIALPGDKENRVAQALAWLDVVESEDESVRSIHQRAETALHVTGFLIVAAAIALGAAATLGAFYFDGSGRINAVSVLAVLVAVPGLFILPFAIAALPSTTAERVPGVRLVAALAGAFSPGRLAPIVWRVFPHDLRESIALLSGRLGKHHRLYASLQKWAVLRWSQLFALSFQITALVACLVLVVFTDLAFGWSTTLTTGNPAFDAQRVHRVTTAIATPWRWVLPTAQPSLELIQQSRYFRAAPGTVSFDEAARLGGWWKFVVLTLAVYGVAPRLVTFAVAQTRLRSAARAAMLEAPGLSAVLRRIHRAQIKSAALEPEPAEDRPSQEIVENPSRSGASIRAVINWADVPVPADVFAKHLRDAPVFQAGGAAALADDLALARRIGAIAGPPDAGVLIVVKAWEPPLMEFIDFIATLRSSLPVKSSTISVLPVGLSEHEPLSPGTPAQVKLWHDKLARVGDPWLRVAASREEVLA